LEIILHSKIYFTIPIIETKPVKPLQAIRIYKGSFSELEVDMCGRFTLTADPGVLQEAFPVIKIQLPLKPRYNIAPTQSVAVIANTPDYSLNYFHWGLIPSWAKDPEIGNRLINARSETLAEKPSFRSAFRRRRCLIPADGFFEWKSVSDQKTKIPMYIKLKSSLPFAFAGLWEIWSSPDGSQIYSCTIITTQPNHLMESIHNRMPVILHPTDYQVWLDPNEQTPESFVHLFRPYPAEEMAAYPVSRIVNSPQADIPECIKAVGPEN
jgi:putative SOS response-associated peptidase YedK